MLIRLREERGIALITVLLVLMVFVSLSLAAVQLVAHNAESSAYSRKRDQAIQAAEAGLDSYVQTLRTSSGTAVCPSTSPVQIAENPDIDYTLDVSIFDSAGTKIGCTSPAYAGTPVAASALVEVAGRAGTTANTPQEATRTLQARLTLTPLNTIDKAIVGNSQLTISGSANIVRYQTFPDADLYSNGNLDLSASGMSIEGSAYAQGYIIVKGCVQGDLWANGYVQGDGGKVGLTCDGASGFSNLGDVTSSTSYVDWKNTNAYGVCTAGTTFTSTSGGKCKALGPGPYTSSPDAIAGSPQGPPPSYSFPQLSSASVISDLQASGYSLNTYADCTTARTAILAAPVGNRIFRITPACALSFANLTTLNMRGNYAIVTDGSFATVNNNTWNTAVGSCTGNSTLYPGNRCTLHIIRPYNAATNCGTQPIAGPSAPGTYGIATSNNTNFSGINFFAYTQCDVTFQNQGSSSHGQLIGGWAQVTNNFALSYYPIFVPGLATGYSSALTYVREI